jgi:hypothetical protein
MHVFLDDFEICNLPNSGRRHENYSVVSVPVIDKLDVNTFKSSTFLQKLNLLPLLVIWMYE